MAIVAMAVACLAAACAVQNAPVPANIQPGYTFALGASYNDVLGMLGHPQSGPRLERYSNLTEVVYSYPFKAIKAETRFPDGTVRVELVDFIHLFFDQKGLLKRMGHRVNQYYTSFTDMPVDRITIAPRSVDSLGQVRPVPPLAPPHPAR